MNKWHFLALFSVTLSREKSSHSEFLVWCHINPQSLFSLLPGLRLSQQPRPLCLSHKNTEAFLSPWPRGISQHHQGTCWKCTFSATTIPDLPTRSCDVGSEIWPLPSTPALGDSVWEAPLLYSMGHMLQGLPVLQFSPTSRKRKTCWQELDDSSKNWAFGRRSGV